MGRLNPNLYEDGKVCLSLLRTWHGKGVETWSISSNILQLLVSIQGLVLVKEPYYNAAGYDRQVGTEQADVNSARYNERAFLLNLKSVIWILENRYPGFEKEIDEFYYRKGELRAIERIERPDESGEGEGVEVLSKGGLKMLKVGQPFCLST